MSDRPLVSERRMEKGRKRGGRACVRSLCREGCEGASCVCVRVGLSFLSLFVGWAGLDGAQEEGFLSERARGEREREREERERGERGERGFHGLPAYGSSVVGLSLCVLGEG